MARNEPIIEFWEILNLFEDVVKGGVRTVHEKLPVRRGESGNPGDAGRTGGSGERESAGGPGDSGAPRAATKPGERARIQTRKAEEILASLEKEIAGCTKCRLHESRTNTVPGEGVVTPLVFVIGEGPGAEEDRSGRPFVGKAGQYLDKWLDAIGLSRKTNVYIGNIVKCRPPGNRDPQPDEYLVCLPYLEKQIELLNPRAILAVGRIAAQVLINTDMGIGKMRGMVHKYNSIPLIATYHPSAVLRNPELRRPVWDDLKLLKTLLPLEE